MQRWRRRGPPRPSSLRCAGCGGGRRTEELPGYLWNSAAADRTGRLGSSFHHSSGPWLVISTRSIDRLQLPWRAVQLEILVSAEDLSTSRAVETNQTWNLGQRSGPSIEPLLSRALESVGVLSVLARRYWAGLGNSDVPAVTAARSSNLKSWSVQRT